MESAEQAKPGVESQLLEMGFEAERVRALVAEHPSKGVEELVGLLETETPLSEEEVRLKALELQKMLREKT